MEEEKKKQKNEKHFSSQIEHHQQQQKCTKEEICVCTLTDYYAVLFVQSCCFIRFICFKGNFSSLSLSLSHRLLYHFTILF